MDRSEESGAESRLCGQGLNDQGLIFFLPVSAAALFPASSQLPLKQAARTERHLGPAALLHAQDGDGHVATERRGRQHDQQRPLRRQPEGDRLCASL